MIEMIRHLHCCQCQIVIAAIVNVHQRQRNHSIELHYCCRFAVSVSLQMKLAHVGLLLASVAEPVQVARHLLVIHTALSFHVTPNL